MRLKDLFRCRLEEADATGEVPVLHHDIAIAIEEDAVGGAEDAFGDIGGLDVVGRPLLLVGVVAEDGDDLVVLVENDDAGLELGDGNLVAADRDSAGTAQVFSQDLEEFTLEVEVTETAVFAVADEEFFDSVAIVDGETVAGLGLALVLAETGEGFQQFAGGIELEDARATVAVSGEDRAIGTDGDGGGVPSAVRSTDGEQNLACEIELDQAVMRELRSINDFDAILFAQGHAVDTGEFFATEGLEALTGLVEDENADAFRVGRDVVQAGFVLGDRAMQGTELLDPFGQLGPAGNGGEEQAILAGGHRADSNSGSLARSKRRGAVIMSEHRQGKDGAETKDGE